MDLADMLSYADITQVARIAKRYGCVCNEHSKHELIQAILTILGRKDVFEQHVMGMTLEELRFLNSIVFDQRASFSLEELMVRAQQTQFELRQNKEEPGLQKEKKVRDTIASFKHSGWLFNGCNQQTKYLFQVPTDLKRRFKDVLQRSFAAQLTFTSEPHVYRDERGRIGDDIGQLLTFVRNENVRLNAEGVMYKKTQHHLLDTFAIHETTVPKGEWRFGYGRRFHDYPNRLSFIYDYAFFQGWIGEEEGQLRCLQAGEARLAQQGTEPSAALYRFWLRLYKNAIPNIVSLVHWIQLCTVRWTTMESLEAILLPYVSPFYYDRPAAIFRQRIMMMLLHLGLIRLGEDAVLGEVLQVTKKGQYIIEGVYIGYEDKMLLEVDQ